MEQKTLKKHNWLIPDLLAFDVNIWGGMTGQGKTTSLINLLTLNAQGKKLPGTDQIGDKRPFYIMGQKMPCLSYKKGCWTQGGHCPTFFL